MGYNFNQELVWEREESPYSIAVTALAWIISAGVEAWALVILFTYTIRVESKSVQLHSSDDCSPILILSGRYSSRTATPIT